MSDLISRQAAIDAVDSETVSTNPEHFKSSEKFIKFMDDDDIASFGKWQWANGFNTAVVAAKIQLKNLSTAQPEQQWIPCNERLPETEKKRYWVCTDTEYQCECRWTNNRFGIGEFDEWGWSIFDVPQHCHVVAWMPLPEPYKEEDDAVD